MTLAGAERYLKDNKHALKRDVQILEHLGRIRSALLEIKSELGSESTETEIVVRNEALADAVNELLPGDVSEEKEPEKEEAEEGEAPVEPPVAEAKEEPEEPKPRYIEPTLFDL